MTKRLEASLLFLNEEKAKVYAEEPFDKVLISPPEFEPILPDEYLANTPEENYVPISKTADIVKYIAYLYQEISGSYWRATEAKIIEV